jgi:hypothetical protein
LDSLSAMNRLIQTKPATVIAVKDCRNAMIWIERRRAPKLTGLICPTAAWPNPSRWENSRPTAKRFSVALWTSRVFVAGLPSATSWSRCPEKCAPVRFDRRSYIACRKVRAVDALSEGPNPLRPPFQIMDLHRSLPQASSTWVPASVAARFP